MPGYWIIAVLVLPGTALIFVPSLILYTSRGSAWLLTTTGLSDVSFWLALLFGLTGTLLMVWTASLFARSGQGTLAPWKPPRRFVAKGPYRLVRNPMITGVFLVLLAEAFLFRSWAIAAWLLLFVIINAVYIPLVEEKALEQRFGDEYTIYKQSVPRWIPRRTAWIPEQR
jgi:protein-S-isoprenylcysteine O-methyltransferase Ste14